MGRLKPYLQTLGNAKKPTSDKHSSLLQNVGKLRTKKFYNIGSMEDVALVSNALAYCIKIQ